MKLFTVREQAERGLLVTNMDDHGCEPMVIIGTPGRCTYVPLGGELRHVFQSAQDAGLDELRLNRAELATTGTMRFIKERNPRDYRALVHVDTECGEGGMLKFYANSYEEEVVRGRIVRRYDPFPPVGVEVVALGASPCGAPQGLLYMNPGASFRIERSGDLQGVSPVLIVAWPGSTLRCFPPKKYRESEAA